MWGVSDSSPTKLLTFDPATETVLSQVPISSPERLKSLAIDPTDGQLYGASATSLYRVVPETGVATAVGATPLPVDKALGFDLAGNLYGVSNNNQLVAVNKTTGATSLIAAMQVSRMEDIAVRPETGVMYGVGYLYPPGPGYHLFQINLADGSLNRVGGSLSRPDGLAFAAPPPMDDGDVDGADFLHWERGFGRTAAAHLDGDANYDGQVTAYDLIVWQSQFGLNQAMIQVPECLSPAFLLGVAIVAARRRAR